LQIDDKAEDEKLRVFSQPLNLLTSYYGEH